MKESFYFGFQSLWSSEEMRAGEPFNEHQCRCVDTRSAQPAFPEDVNECERCQGIQNSKVAFELLPPCHVITYNRTPLFK